MLKKKEAWDRQRWNDDSRWEWSDYGHKYMWIGQKPERESPYEACSATLLGFGDFKGWRYGEILTDKPRYVAHLWAEHEVSSPEKKMLTV